MTLLATILAGAAKAGGVAASEVSKANNTTDLDLPESWVGGVTPAAGDVAVWDATVSGPNSSTFTTDQTWAGIRVANPGGTVTVNGTSLMLTGIGAGIGLDLSAATNNLVLNSTIYLSGSQEWNIGTGRTATVGTVFGTGLALTKTGNGTLRFAENAFFQSLNLLGGRVETLSNGGVIDAPGGISLGGVNPGLALGRPQTVPPLFVAPGTTGAALELALPSSSVNLSSVILDSPLTIRRTFVGTTTAVVAMDAPILGGTAPGTDAVIFSALNPATPSYWLTRSLAPNEFTGNVRFEIGKWNLQATTSTFNRIFPDASLVTIHPPAQVTWAMSGMQETVDGLAGAGTLQFTGTNNTFSINANNPANDGARVFSGGLTLAGSATLIFSGSGTQVLAGNRITYGGATTINSGTLVLRDATAFASSVTLNGGTLELQATSGTWTYGKKITGGAGDLMKSGDGTVTLTAAATHTGKTVIAGGTLALGTGGALANTSEVVLNGGNFSVSALPSGYQVSALLGNGSIAGSVTVSSRLAIGNSPGTMAFEQLTLGAGALAEFEVTGGGTAADLGNVSGQLNLNGATLALIQLGTYTPDQKYTLFAYNFGNLLGTFAGLPDGAEFTAAGGPWRIDYADPLPGLNGGIGTRFVTLTAVPEPTAVALCCVALVGIGLRRRRC